MKLAEALANRADLQRRIEQMRGRLQKSALVQEGESPPEDPQELLEETERLVSELEGYVRRINRTNLSATLADAHGRPGAPRRPDAALRDPQYLREHGIRQASALRAGGDPHPARCRGRTPEAQDGRTGPPEARARHRHPAGQLGDRSHGGLNGSVGLPRGSPCSPAGNPRLRGWWRTPRAASAL